MYFFFLLGMFSSVHCTNIYRTETEIFLNPLAPYELCAYVFIRFYALRSKSNFSRSFATYEKKNRCFVRQPLPAPHRWKNKCFRVSGGSISPRVNNKIKNAISTICRHIPELLVKLVYCRSLLSFYLSAGYKIVRSCERIPFKIHIISNRPPGGL